MAPPSSKQNFIDNVLYNTTRYSLPYTDPVQKSVIRTHLLGTIQNFPSLTLSLDTFTTLNGTVFTLFKLTGFLSGFSVTVWVHQDYPYISPVVFTTPDHTPSIKYLTTWRHPRSTLLGLVETFEPGLAREKADALNRVQKMIASDLIFMEACHVEAIDAHVAIQDELRSRGEELEVMLGMLKSEVLCLEKVCVDMRLHADVLANWILDVRKGGALGYEVADEESRQIQEWLAGEKAVEDVMYALDKAVEERVLGFDVYLRKIRALAREQFFFKAKLVKFKGHEILDFC